MAGWSLDRLHFRPYNQGVRKGPGRPRKHRTLVDAQAAAAKRNRKWHYPYIPSSMPWRVLVEGKPVAVFVVEADARDFAATSQYGERAIVMERKGRGGRPRTYDEED